MTTPRLQHPRPRQKEAQVMVSVGDLLWTTRNQSAIVIECHLDKGRHQIKGTEIIYTFTNNSMITF